MKINSINSLIGTNFVHKNNKTNINSKSNLRNSYAMPTSVHYISFTGGSSLDLKQSVKNLESLGRGDGSKFPPNVLDMAHEVIESGNSDNKTLIDVHKEKYSMLNECYDLNEAKSLFDEFSGVLSDTEIDYRQDSFIGRVKQGQEENFNKDEDLAFQLLKLYWAEGFSLNDLKRYAGTDLYHTLGKFNIPLMDRDYAHVLKFSDKEYNERLTSQMAQKRMESMDRKAQEQEGEPVYIPRGPLSESHKKHISEGLIKYYALHPEKTLAMSKRQKEYFENNPKQKIVMQRVMFYAWNNTQEGRSIKKYLVKFFKKLNISLDENVMNADSEKMTVSQQDALKLFWKKNSWAKEKFSKAVKAGWNHVQDVKKVETDNSVKKDEYKIEYIPDNFVTDVLKWMCEHDGEVVDNPFVDSTNFILPDVRDSHTLKTALETYVKTHPDTKDMLVSVASGALISLRHDMACGKIPNSVCDNKSFLDAISTNIDDLLYPAYIANGLDFKYSMPEIINGEDAARLIGLISQLCKLHKQAKFAQYVQSKIETSYNLFTDITTPQGRDAYLKFLGV